MHIYIKLSVVCKMLAVLVTISARIMWKVLRHRCFLITMVLIPIQAPQKEKMYTRFRISRIDMHPASIFGITLRAMKVWKRNSTDLVVKLTNKKQFPVFLNAGILGRRDIEQHQAFHSEVSIL
jgi:hypothetical protein